MRGHWIIVIAWEALLVSLPAVEGLSFVRATCTSNLIIDNYSQYAQNLNSIGSWTSDDGSMASLTASTANKKITFTPKTNGSSYFYTSFDNCISATADGYNAITFPLKGPAGGSFLLEIQTSSACASAGYTSYSHGLTGLTGSVQTITVPLSSFAGANLGVIKAWVWSGFSGEGSWELGQTSFVCANGSGSSVGGSESTSSSPASTNSISTSDPVSFSTTTTSSFTPAGKCSALLIDDWASQSRLTFLFYNAMIQPSSDDGTMTSIVVSNNRVTLTPKAGSYFYSSFGCVSALKKYGGISLRIKAPAGAAFTVELQSRSTCSSSSFVGFGQTTAQLGWTFDGTEQLYSIPFSSFSGLDTTKLTAVLFGSFDGRPVTFGPMAFYCGKTSSEYIPPPTSTAPDATSTVPIATATASALVIDQFENPNTNTLGLWHGGNDPTRYSISGGRLTITFNDPDSAFYTRLSGSCRDMNGFAGAYLHIAYTGSNLFTVALQQHNAACNAAIAPYPETWDVVEARRYASSSDIYVPLSHFDIIKSRVIGVALKAFQSSAATVISKIEIVPTVPSSFTGSISAKIPTAPLFFSCTRPNSFAFAIDDGVPGLAQEVMKIIKEEGIKVTFFTVGAPLADPRTNLSNVYADMLSQGHQVALHSFSHPKMESLPTSADIDWEIQKDIAVVRDTLHTSSAYFRPPFGTEGARLRQRLAANIAGAKVINWSVDVEDWLWALSPTPEKQLDAFNRDVARGGNLAVLHYLYPSTVGYLKQFIAIARGTGKTLMRVDQCLEDPAAPPLS